jgi:hypothetical protein
MPTMVTFDEMRQFVYKNLHKSKILLETAQESVDTKNTFLSYSSKDNEYIPYVINILENHGAKVYIDKGDDRLPNPPSVKTAAILKDSIHKCNRMVVFVTTNSKDSKWVPWELGLGDGSKTNKDIALFPSAENSYETSWLSQEYLGLYRRIVWGKLVGFDKEVWMVYNHHDNTATELSKWLRGY